MKFPLLILSLAFALVGCETIENADGSTTTRFDAKAATEGINTAFDVYQRYDRQSRVVGYDIYGNPVYRQ